MTLCVLGNSHGVCVKRYVSGRAPHLDIDFYLAVGSAFDDAGFELEDGVISSSSPMVRQMFAVTSRAKSTKIRLADYDGFLFVGEPAFRMHLNVNRYGTEKAFDPTVQRRMIGHAQYRDYVVDMVSHGAGPDLLRKVLAGKAKHATVAVAMTPNYTQSQFEAKYPKRRNASTIHAMYDLVDDALAGHFASLGVTYLPQLRETMTEDGYTQERFRRDETHANEDYARLVLEQWRGSAATTAGGAAA